MSNGWASTEASLIDDLPWGGGVFSITFHPDGYMYGTISNIGIFVQIDPADLSAESWSSDGSGSSMFGYKLNSMPNGNIYFTTMTGGFGGYDVENHEPLFVEQIGFNSTTYAVNDALTVINGELYASIWHADPVTQTVYPNNKIVKVNLEDPVNSELVFEMPDNRRIAAMTTFNYDCDSTVTYIAVRNTSSSSITGHDIYQFNEKVPSLTFVTELNDIGLIVDFANPTEHLQFDCVPVLDLNVGESGLDHFTPAICSEAAQTVYPFETAVPAVLTNTIVDSIWVGISAGAMDGAAEGLSCAPGTSLDCTPSANGVMLHNTAHMDNTELVDAMEQAIVYQNNAAGATEGERQLAVVAFKKQYPSDTAYLYLPLLTAAQAVISGGEQPVCPGQSTELAVGTEAATYEWSNGATGQQISAGPGQYNVTLTDSDGCTSTASANVEQAENPVATPATMPASCHGGNDGLLTLSVSGGTPPYEVQFEGAPLPFPYTINGLSAGEYGFGATDANGCTDNGPATVTEPDPIWLDAERDFFIGVGEQADINLSTNATLIESVEWAPLDGLEISGQLSASAAPRETTAYLITLTTAEGCTSSTEVEVEVATNPILHQVYVPNAFSPNNDGTNDLFTAFPSDGAEISFIKVYGRWGTLVFDGKKGQAWDGTMAGQELPPGVYLYLIEWSGPDGRAEVLSGEVNMVR